MVKNDRNTKYLQNFNINDSFHDKNERSSKYLSNHIINNLFRSKMTEISNIHIIHDEQLIKSILSYSSIIIINHTTQDQIQSV